MEGLTTIHLGGKLGQLFGKRWDLMVNSPAEAIRAIDINLKGKLRAYLTKQGISKFYKVGVGNKDALLGERELANRSGRSAIYISPVAKGKNSGLGKIIAAVAIAAFVISNPFGWAAFAIGSTMATTGVGAMIGLSLSASLLLGGVAQLLTPAPNFNNNPEGGETRGSNLFGGNASAITQGGAVGLVYGRALVTPMPVSISFDNKDQAMPEIDIGGFCTRDDGNGLISYNPSDGTVCP